MTPATGTVPVGDSTALYYDIQGSAADTVVVPLGVFLDSALAPLARTHTVVFYDPRQRGRSTHSTDTTRSTFAADVEDLERVRAELGLSRMALVGFSYYAAVAASYAAAHPQRVARLVLLSPIELTDSLAQHRDGAAAMSRIDTVQARRLVRWRAAGKDTVDATAYCQAYWAVNASVYVGDTAHAKRVRTDMCSLPNEGIRSFAQHMALVLRSMGPRRDLTRAANAVTAPTLVIRGDRDLVANPEGARAWAAAIPNARLLTIRGGGHLVYVDDPGVITRALTTFLGQAWPDAAEQVR